MRAADLFLYLHAVAALNINVGRRRALAGCFSGAVGLVAVPSRSRATGAADELYELVRTRRPSQWQDSERARIDALVSEVVAQNAPWPRAGLVGKWRLAYLQPGPKGEGVDRRIPFPEFGFNEQYQIFRQNPGRVTNVGEVLGPAVRSRWRFETRVRQCLAEISCADR